MNEQEMAQVMSDAMGKAIKNGWKGSPLIDNVKDYRKLLESKLLVDIVYGLNWYELIILYLPPHDFAKALWGEEESAEVITRWHRQSNIKDDFIGDLIPNWKKHLQQMVIAEDPIKYLGDNI